ncbi:hypothetical protein MMC22_007394 [Lobaria immixta]|nr:hypothetical protein [Lobaria immixta]
MLIQAGAKVDVCRARVSLDDHELNSLARFAPHGTPLDIAMRKRSEILAEIKPTRTVDSISSTRYRFQLNTFDKIANILKEAAIKEGTDAQTSPSG